MLYRIEQEENGNYVKDDKRYELQSCREFVPAKDKTISDYGWLEFETEEKAIEYFGITKVEQEAE
jgi:hypothetical protein